MTIAAGFRCMDGILLCSDSQFTGADKGFRDKIITQFGGRSHIAFAFSGDEDYARSAIEECTERIDALSLGGAPQVIKACIRETVSKMSSQYRNHYPNGADKPEFLISISTPDERPQLFRARDSITPSVDHLAFLGCGAYLGEYLLESFFGSQFVSIEDTLLPAIFVLTAAVGHDLYCGGHLQLYGARNQRFHRTWFNCHNDDPANIIRSFQHECGVVMMFMSGSKEDYFKRVLESFPDKMTALRNELMSHDGYRHLLEFMMDSISETSQT
jgi:hypothetical protein